MGSMLRLGSVVVAGTLALGAPHLVRADDAGAPVTVTLPSTAIDSAIHDYLKRNPEVVNEAMNAYQAKMEAKKQADAQEAIGSKSSEIYDPSSPTAGNPQGTETVVEFFDYSCHFCKQIHPDLQTLIKQDPNVKIIYKDFPILGPGSVVAAKAALAAQMQGKYLPMHDALLDFKGALDDDSVKQIAGDIGGLDYAKLKADMESPTVIKQLSDNRALADQLDIHGTPSMIVNKKLVDGALPLDELKKRLADKS